MEIKINIENPDDVRCALEEVANSIEQGYTNGFIGCSGDTWEINE